MTKITVIGDINVDLLTSPVRSIPKKDLQTLIPYMNLTIGGGAANFAFAISKLGLKTRLVGLVGNDVFGEYIIKKVKGFGIENRIRKTNKEKTGITFGIQFEDGSKSLLTFRGTNSLFSKKDFKWKEINGRVLHIAGYNLLDNFRKDVYEILKYAKKKKMLTSLDPDIKVEMRFDLKELEKVLKFVDMFFLNKIEGKILTQDEKNDKIVKKLLDFGCKIVALKCGKEGCIVGNKGKIYKIKGIKVRAINPTGIGDIFNASFVFSYLKTGNIKQAGIFANGAGALAITRANEERFVTEKEVLRFLKNRYGR